MSLMSGSNIILNRFFSRKTLREWIDRANSPSKVYCSIIKKYVKTFSGKKNKEIICEIYKLLKKEYRNEYYYKNTLLNELLLKYHNPYTTTALSEIPVSKSIADFILLNGKATVYEIKTELDSFERLDSQLSNYFKAFDNVCVVVPEAKLDSIINKLSNEKIGILYLTKRGALKKFRCSISYSNELDKESIFKILRKYEYENIISHFFELPAVSQFKYYDACKELFNKIPLERLYKEFKFQLKLRNVNDMNKIISVPKEIRSVVYFSKLKDKEYVMLNEFLESKFGG